MKIAFITDPIETFNPVAETTSFLARAFYEKGAQCYFSTLKDLMLYNGKLLSKATLVKIMSVDQKFKYTTLDQAEIDLASCEAVWLRKDPPFDVAYLDHLSLFETIENKTLILNRPSGIKQAPEKIFALNEPWLSPKSLVTQNKEALLDFINQHKKVVIKPLNLSGGRGIVIVKNNQEGLSSLIEVLTNNQTQFVCAQKFIKKAALGDKRVLIWNQSILGQFIRKPGQNDFRGNLHFGATFHKANLTKTENAKVKALLPRLKELGLYFVGLDFLDEQITEVNVTSPMGLRELNTLYSYHYEKTVVKSLISADFKI